MFVNFCFIRIHTLCDGCHNVFTYCGYGGFYVEEKIDCAKYAQRTIVVVWWWQLAWRRSSLCNLKFRICIPKTHTFLQCASGNLRGFPQAEEWVWSMPYKKAFQLIASISWTLNWDGQRWLYWKLTLKIWSCRLKFATSLLSNFYFLDQILFIFV